MTDNLLILKETIAEILVESLKMNLIANDPYVVGGNTYPGLINSNLYNDITYEIQGDSVVILMPSYAVYVDSGRVGNGVALNAKRKKGDPKERGFPNIDAIERWILRKFSSSQLTRIYASPGGLNTVVYLISRTIARRGIQARPFIQASLDEAVNSLRFDIGLDAFIDQELIKIFLT
jgi:hypothetical protein